MIYHETYFFLANLSLKHGISSEYVMVYFICEGLLEFSGTRIENYEVKNSCPQWGSNSVLSAYEANALTIGPQDMIAIDHLKIDCVLPECAI